MQSLEKEQNRLALQANLDADKTKAARNQMGQFATPTSLALDILKFGINLLPKNKTIRFLDPAFGTGSFFSALLQIVSKKKIEVAKGFEIDSHYGEPALELWKNNRLDLKIEDFTRSISPSSDANRFNLLICNPPYVRHHHILNGEKHRLQKITKAISDIKLSGLAGLYCYFLIMSQTWMQRSGIAGWLIPSEFMDVNYGEAIKHYLLNKVTLLRIHRFDPTDVQFDDALVSSTVVWFRNDPPPDYHRVEFSFGGTLSTPNISRTISGHALRKERKWTRFPKSDVRGTHRYKLSDFFTIKRGIATGDNKFFILNKDQIKSNQLPAKFFRPILPSPRYVPSDVIEANQKGVPLLDNRLYLLDCRLSEEIVRERYPTLWDYLQKGTKTVSKRYLCRTRKVWYFQEERLPVPILCTYMGRSMKKNGHPFRFMLNYSKAIATNVYLFLYPNPLLARIIEQDRQLLKQLWVTLNSLPASSLLEEGRVYGGGLHKLEPKELANVDATALANLVPELKGYTNHSQINLLDKIAIHN